ncbi:Phosphate regulon sensor protein PhoR (SphS) [plant metagenome]|uniref:histidine kinase n=1 Tax=plant metagenome TaxID=1297885 RepID=A0A484TP76_9ZZZZ
MTPEMLLRAHAPLDIAMMLGWLAWLLPGLFLAALLAVGTRARRQPQAEWLGLLALVALEFLAVLLLPPPPGWLALALPPAIAALGVRHAPGLPRNGSLVLGSSYLANLPALAASSGLMPAHEWTLFVWQAGLALRALACLGMALQAVPARLVPPMRHAPAPPHAGLAEAEEWATAVHAYRQAGSLLAHELRAPLSTLDSAVQALALAVSDDDEHARARLARMRRAVQRVTELTGNFLGSGMLGERLLQPRTASQDLGKLARGTALQMQADMAHPLDMPTEGQALAVCDAVLCVEVLRNLLHNAAKYSPADQPISLRWGTDDTAGQAWVSVADRGPGIGEEELARIFEPHYRRTAHRETKGMGVGLYLAREMCRRQRGELSVQSRDGHGSVFTLRLPMAQADTSDQVAKT